MLHNYPFHKELNDGTSYVGIHDNRHRFISTETGRIVRTEPIKRDQVRLSDLSNPYRLRS